jgi:4-hydroxy-tetrahydrodipicolinate synthase
VKEASGNIGQMAKILSNVPESFTVLSGDDAVTLPLMSLGGRGIISVASNQIPAEMSQLAAAGLKGDFETARRFQRKYQDLMDVNFVESNPQPVKYAMSLMGLLEPVWRLPMVAPQPESQQKIESVLRKTGLLGGAER